MHFDSVRYGMARLSSERDCGVGSVNYLKESKSCRV